MRRKWARLAAVDGRPCSMLMAGGRVECECRGHDCAPHTTASVLPTSCQAHPAIGHVQHHPQPLLDVAQHLVLAMLGLAVLQRSGVDQA